MLHIPFQHFTVGQLAAFLHPVRTLVTAIEACVLQNGFAQIPAYLIRDFSQPVVVGNMILELAPGAEGNKIEYCWRWYSSPLYLLWSVAAKQKLWLSLVGSLMSSVLLFMMVPMLTPLDSTIVNVFGCGLGGALFSVGLGAISNRVLKTTSLV